MSRYLATRSKMPTDQRGMLYLGVLIFVAMSSLIGLKVAQAIAYQVQRDVELDLLQAGREIQKAIGEYYGSSPGSLKIYPTSLEALLQDERFLDVRRHLRKVHIDPITKQSDWVLIKAVQGGIQGVASASQKQPIRKANFLANEGQFGSAKTYQEWKFVYIPLPTNRTPANTTGGEGATTPSPSTTPTNAKKF